MLLLALSRYLNCFSASESHCIHHHKSGYNVLQSSSWQRWHPSHPSSRGNCLQGYPDLLFHLAWIRLSLLDWGSQPPSHCTEYPGNGPCDGDATARAASSAYGDPDIGRAEGKTASGVRRSSRVVYGCLRDVVCRLLVLLPGIRRHRLRDCWLVYLLHE